MQHLLALFLLTVLGWKLPAQDTSFLKRLPPPDLQQLAEDLLPADEGDEGAAEFNTTLDHLELYRDHPLDLNRAGENDLRELRLLSERQIQALLDYRHQIGPFITLYELQAVPALDLAAIRRLLPFITLGRRRELGPRQLLRLARPEVYLRWSRVLERQAGYRPAPDGGQSAYLGDANQVYGRFRYRYGNRLSVGLTAEKDRGEPFGANGFDFHSFHLYVRDYSPVLQALALGDYGINLGQGLLFNGGFGYGKSSVVTAVRQGGHTVQPYTSVNEAAFLRGAAFTLRLSPHLELSAFASHRRRDGNVIEPSSAERSDSLPFLTSLNEAGLHRTIGEIADRNAARLRTYGANLSYARNRYHLSANVLYNQLDKPLLPRPQPYNRFYFRGDRLLNASIDYGVRWRNLSFFGETAASQNGAAATLNGLLAGLGPHLDVAIVHRHYPRHFQSLQSAAFGETGEARNESGIYLGLDLRPHPHWQLSAFYDLWRHPWLRFQVDAPSDGQEYRLRLTYRRRRHLEVYTEVRHEVKERNADEANQPLPRIVPYARFQTRLHLALQLSRALEWRSRVDWGYAGAEGQTRQYGFGLYQDLLFRPLQFPLSFTTRFALFETDGYAVRFYNYENGLLYNFSVPAYYNRGSRFYLNLRYNPLPFLTVEARVAQLFWDNQDSIGTGPEATGRPTRTEVGAQVRMKW